MLVLFVFDLKRSLNHDIFIAKRRLFLDGLLGGNLLRGLDLLLGGGLWH